MHGYLTSVPWLLCRLMKRITKNARCFWHLAFFCVVFVLFDKANQPIGQQGSQQNFATFRQQERDNAGGQRRF